MRFLPSLALVLAAGTGMAAPALAKPALVSATPAEGASADKPNQIALTFSEAVNPAASGIEVVMTGMPGMEHHQPMKMGGVKVAVSSDGKVVTATLPRPLPTGSYAARWFAAGNDAERASGTLAFTVR